MKKVFAETWQSSPRQANESIEISTLQNRQLRCLTPVQSIHSRLRQNRMQQSTSRTCCYDLRCYQTVIHIMQHHSSGFYESPSTTPRKAE